MKQPIWTLVSFNWNIWTPMFFNWNIWTWTLVCVFLGGCGLLCNSLLTAGARVRVWCDDGDEDAELFLPANAAVESLALAAARVAMPYQSLVFVSCSRAKPRRRLGAATMVIAELKKRA
jgi:hypothetical protein